MTRRQRAHEFVTEPSPDAPNCRPNVHTWDMRRHPAALLAAALVVTALTACAASTPAVAHATVADRTQAHRAGSADLIDPHATTATARTEIQQYTMALKGVDLYFVMVKRSDHDTRYVCRGIWYRNAASWHANGNPADPTPTVWPHTTLYC